MDPVKFHETPFYQTDPKLANLICRHERVIKCRQRKAQAVAFAKLIDRCDIEVPCEVKKWVFVVLEELIGRFARPILNIHFKMHFLFEGKNTYIPGRSNCIIFIALLK